MLVIVAGQTASWLLCLHIYKQRIGRERKKEKREGKRRTLAEGPLRSENPSKSSLTGSCSGRGCRHSVDAGKRWSKQLTDKVLTLTRERGWCRVMLT